MGMVEHNYISSPVPFVLPSKSTQMRNYSRIGGFTYFSNIFMSNLISLNGNAVALNRSIKEFSFKISA